MNSNDKLNFNGRELTIGDILKKQNKEILIALYIQTHDLKKLTKNICGKIDDIDKKIDNQWSKIGENGKSIGRINGTLCVLVILVVGIVSFLALSAR